MSIPSVERPPSFDAFMPHGMCYSWQPGVLSLHILSDAFIALAYFSIPFALVYLVRNRPDMRFHWVFVCFAIFIVACGCTHLMEIWTIWHPMYWLSGAIKAVTALASVATAILLIKLIPLALRLPGPSALEAANVHLEQEIRERIRAEQELRQTNEALEGRVEDRTAELEQVNRTLKEDGARFTIAAEAAGLGFWTFDGATRTLQWDHQMCLLYGQAPRAGKRPYSLWVDALHPDDRERCERESIEAMNGAGGYATEYRIVRPNGAIRHLRAAGRVVRDAEGRAVRMFGVNFDITERKSADEKFRLAIDAAPTGMLLMSLTGSIVLVNAEIELLFGYTRAELLGRQIEMLVPARYHLHHADFRKTFFGSPTVRKMGLGRELYGLRKDGFEVPVEIGLTPIQTSDGEFVLSSIVDLSQRREVERMRADFVSTVSHELRTPLTSIRGSLGLLQSGSFGVLPERAVEMLRIAYENSGRLVRIINDILDIGKLEAGQLVLNITTVSLRRLLQQSIEANSGYAEKYNVRFLLENGSADDYVMADPDRLMQVITNLLSNAANFTAPGSDVLIRVRPALTTLRVEVEDCGPGIPVEFQGRIFEKFAQADGCATRRHEGTGLGLSIARKLIEAMGGTIGFSSVVVFVAPEASLRCSVGTR